MVERRIGKLRISKNFSAARVQQDFVARTLLSANRESSLHRVDESGSVLMRLAVDSEQKPPNIGTLADAEYRRIKIEYQSEDICLQVRTARGKRVRSCQRAAAFPQKQMRPEPATRAALFERSFLFVLPRA